MTVRSASENMGPEIAVVFHRLGVVVAEVVSATNARANASIASAEAIARDLRALARDGTVLWEHERSMAVAEISGPRAARKLTTLRVLLEAAESFAPRFEWFMKEHGAVVEPRVATTLNDFLPWLRGRVDELRARERTFREQFVGDLESDRARLDKLAGEWAIADADGWE